MNSFFKRSVRQRRSSGDDKTFRGLHSPQASDFFNQLSAKGSDFFNLPKIQEDKDLVSLPEKQDWTIDRISVKQERDLAYRNKRLQQASSAAF